MPAQPLDARPGAARRLPGGPGAERQPGEESGAAAAAGVGRGHVCGRDSGAQGQIARILDLGCGLLDPRRQGCGQIQALHPAADLHQATVWRVRRRAEPHRRAGGQPRQGVSAGGPRSQAGALLPAAETGGSAATGVERDPPAGGQDRRRRHQPAPGDRQGEPKPAGHIPPSGTT